MRFRNLFVPLLVCLSFAAPLAMAQQFSSVEERMSSADFKAAGAQIVNSADQVWAEADLLLKVKEPIEPEYSRMRKGQTLFTYLHLAASRPCTDALLACGTTSISD